MKGKMAGVTAVLVLVVLHVVVSIDPWLWLLRPAVHAPVLVLVLVVDVEGNEKDNEDVLLVASSAIIRIVI